MRLGKILDFHRVEKFVCRLALVATGLLSSIVGAEEHPWGEVRDLDPTSGCSFRGKLNLWGHTAEYGDAWVAAFAGSSTTPCAVAQVNASGNVVMNILKYIPFTLRFEIWDSRAHRLYAASNTITYSVGEDEKDNQTITVTGTPPSFNVTFSLTGVAGGSGTRIGGGTLSQTVQRCSGATAPIVSASQGYEFLMWDEDFSCIKCDTVVHAVYQVKGEEPEPPITERRYAVSYVLNGGSYASEHPTSATFDQAFSVSTPTRNGYFFTGWTVTSGLDPSTAKWGTTSDPSWSISSSLTQCANGTGGSVWFKNLTSTANGSVTLTANWASGNCPVNDDFANATMIVGESGVESGSNANATYEVGEPTHISSGVTSSVWWKWTATSSGNMMIKTEGSGFDTVLAVYTGASLLHLTQIVANDDTSLDSSALWSSVSFPTVAGTTYYIAVAGWAGRTGEIQLKWNHGLAFGVYFKKTLGELGFDVPTDGTAYSVTAYGLPTGLKLVKSPAVTKKVKSGGKTKTVVVTPAGVNWWIEGVPTAARDHLMMPSYLTITVGSQKTTVPVHLSVNAQLVVNLGELYIGEAMNEQNWLPGIGSGWSVSGLPTGLKYTAKLVTKKTKKTVNKRKVTTVTTIALPNSVYGKPTKAGLYTITAKKKVSGYYETQKYRVLVMPKPINTALFGDELDNLESMAYVPFEWNLRDDVAAVGGKVAKVTGLPTGLTFAAANTYAYKNAKKKTGKYLKQAGQTIVGTPTKPGTFVVTFTKNVKSGKKTVAKTAQILWVVTKNEVGPEMDFNTAGGVIEEGLVGLGYTDLLVFHASYGAKVTASGLPPGIKLVNRGGDSWGFTGTVTKAGTYYVTVKATQNGRTVTQCLALKVAGLPSWAKGTFNGGAYNAILDLHGLATVSVTSAGKISGKFSENGTNWTLSASNYTYCGRGEDGQPSFYMVDVTAKHDYKVKSGKKTVTRYLTRTFTLDVYPSTVEGGEMALSDMTTGEIGAWLLVQQNLWGSSYKTLGKELFYASKKTPYRTYKVYAFGTRNLTLKVTPTGTVTATLAWNTGKKDKNKKSIVYKPKCTTVLEPWSTSTTPASEFEGVVYVYFPPSSANNFPGFVSSYLFPFSY